MTPADVRADIEGRFRWRSTCALSRLSISHVGSMRVTTQRAVQVCDIGGFATEDDACAHLRARLAGLCAEKPGATAIVWRVVPETHHGKKGWRYYARLSLLVLHRGDVVTASEFGRIDGPVVVMEEVGEMAA